MEFSQELLIDVVLNAAGFILAGLLGLTLYSIIKHKENKSAVPVKTSSIDQRDEFPNAGNYDLGQNKSKRKMEFVDLSHVSKLKPTIDTNINNSGDKAKLLRIAETMIKSGADSKQILKVLPISETELTALIKNIER